MKCLYCKGGDSIFTEDTIFGLAGMVFVLVLCSLSVIIIVSAMRSYADKKYREQAEQYERLATDFLNLGTELKQDFAAIKAKVSVIERILKEVE